jgi:hypothetical protein
MRKVVPSAPDTNDVTLSMNKILNAEVVGAIADALRKPAPPQGNASKGSTSSRSNSTESNRPTSGLMLFIADLLSNSPLSRFLGGGRPEPACCAVPLPVSLPVWRP